MNVSGQFTGVGNSSPGDVGGTFAVAVKNLQGGTVVPQWSYDDGSTWFPGEAITSDNVFSVDRVRKGEKFRLACTVFGTGNIDYSFGDDPTYV